ncbi:MAG TPA: DUF1127 domain-containing protein [Paracoccaceae bacterium]|nr:DUF1127 domain-containing protein [Paracoccaceae bacterium]
MILTLARRAWHLPRPLAALSRAAALRRSRAALMRLDPRLLRDIGLTEAEAQAEAERAAWDVPPHWRAGR